MQDRLRIEIRQRQLYLYNDPTQPVVVSYDIITGIASYVPGLVPKPDWLDVTKDCSGLEEFKLSWNAVPIDYAGVTTDDTTEGNDIGSNYSKGLSSDLVFYGDAYQYIYDWLMTNPAQVANAVEVQITDNECERKFRLLEIKLDNTAYSPEEPCIVSFPLRELDNVYHVFQKTPIEDDWQHWFNSDGASVKQHPTFPFIVEKKPKFFSALYVVLIYVVGMLSTGILIAMDEGKRWIRKSLGFSYFCPSPLIRDYIKNICDKYGYTYDTIFDDLPMNPYRDACLFYPVSQTWKNFDDFSSPSTNYIWDNRTVLPFTKFLNQLKRVFNAEWYVTPNSQLVFKHKSFFDNQPPLYDFTAPGATPIYKLRYTFNGTKKPAYGEYQYPLDPQDNCTNEVKWRYNTLVDYDGPVNNPMLEGSITKVLDFASTAFQNDGSSVDWLKDSIEVGRLIAIGAVLVGLGEIFLATNPLTVAIVAAALAVGYAITNNYVNIFFNNPHLNGIVRTSSSEINMPRLLLWDRSTPLNEAKVVYVDNPAIYPQIQSNGGHVLSGTPCS
jgi:hypothetical protein